MDVLSKKSNMTSESVLIAVLFWIVVQGEQNMRPFGEEPDVLPTSGPQPEIQWSWFRTKP